MKKLLLIFVCPLYLYAQPTRVVTTSPISLSSNAVYNIANSILQSGTNDVTTNFIQNVTFETNVTINHNLNVSGNARFTSNAFFTTVSYSTNAADSETVIDLRKNYRAFVTNNNTAFSALAGIDTTGTNFQSVSVFMTNSSAAATTIEMSEAFQNMNADEGNTLYVTNVGHLLVFHYPGFGTNFYFMSR